MKILALTLITIAAVAFTSCKKEFDFNAQSFNTLRLDKKYSPTDLGFEASDAFNPVSTRISGDTLFIACASSSFTGVVVARKSTGEAIKKLSSWSYNGKTEVFDDAVMDVAVSGSLLFVVNRSSRIDVFKRSDFSYVTTIGSTGWQWSTLLQCEAADVAGDQLFIRDKHRIIVVNIADCTPANRFVVPNFIESTDSTSANNSFSLQSVATYQGMVYVSDYERSRILVVDPKSATTKGGKLAFGRSIVTPSRPLSFSFYKGTILVVCRDNSIVQIDLKSGETVGSFSSFASSIGWGTPGRISFDGDSFYLNSRSSSSAYLIKGSLQPIEITTVN